MPLDSHIHKAAYKGDYGTVEEILDEYPESVNCPGAQNRTPLHRAVGGGPDKKPIASLLLSRNADANIPDNGGLTPLHWAASFGYVNMGRLILDYKANVNAQTNSGETPLHFCAEKGHTEFAQLLLEHDARLDIRDKGANGGATPFDAAKRAKQKECMALLRPGAGGECCVIS